MLTHFSLVRPFHVRNQIKGHILAQQYHLQIKAGLCSVGEQSPCFPQMDACLGHSLITQWRAMDFVSNLARSPKQSSRLRFFYPGCVCVCVCWQFLSACANLTVTPGEGEQWCKICLFMNSPVCIKQTFHRFYY